MTNQTTKSKLTELVKNGITENYINTVKRLDSTAWNIGKEVEALKALLWALQEEGIIEIK